MKLLELDWDAPGGVKEVPVEYPEEPIQAFLNWMRRTTAWHENVELVHRRVRKLNDDLRAAREAKPPAVAVQVPPANPPSALGSGLTTAEKRRAGLAKARAAKQAKRAAATVGGGR